MLVGMSNAGQRSRSHPQSQERDPRALGRIGPPPPQRPGAARPGAVRFRPEAARGDRPGHQSELRGRRRAARDLVEEHAFHRLDSGSISAASSWRFAAARCDPGAARARRRPRGRPWRGQSSPPRVDRAICLSVERFAEAQGRAQRALDRIADASLESEDLDDLLRRLLAVVIETVPAVDTAAILLREECLLRVRAAVGLEREVELGITMAIGEGFAGRIAAQRRPMFLKSAATDPLVKSRVLRERGVRVLYGVPLIEGDTVIGVAHVGSLTVNECSEDDRRIVSSLASRATAAIHQQLLRTRAENAEAGQRFLSEATAILASSLEYEKTLERITALAVPQLADWCAIDLLGPDGKLRTVGLTHRDPTKLELAKRLAEKYPARAEAPSGLRRSSGRASRR